MQVLTKEQIIARLQEIKQMGWIPNARRGNHGGIGNTLEDLLGIKENNLPIPNAAEWELKLLFDSSAWVFDVSPLLMDRGSYRRPNPGATLPQNVP